MYEFVAIKVATREKEGLPIFGKILNILLTEDKILLVCQEWPLQYLEDRLHAYCTEEGKKVCVIDTDDLNDAKPYAIWKSYSSDKDYICLRYALL